ncbi:YybS family protein [Halobacillus faecis]
MNDTKRLTEGALMTGLYLLLLLVIIFMPGPIGSILLLILPVPFVFYSYRYGWKPGVLMFIGSLIFTLLFATVFSLPITLLAGFGGLALGGAMHAKRSSYETLAIGSVGFSIGLLAIFLLTQLFLGVNWMEELRNSMNQAFSTVEGLFSGMMQGEEVKQDIEDFRELIDFIPDIVPSVLAMAGVFMAFVSQWATYKLINRIENQSMRFADFKNFKLPTSVLWYYFVAMILNYVTMDGNDLIYLAAVNVFILTGALIVLQGFSFVFFYAWKKKWSKVIPILVVVFSILLPQIVMYLVRIIGIIDIGFPMRERVEEKKE